MTRVTTKLDRTHWSMTFAFPPSIYLDGIEQHRAVEADDVAGYVVRYADSAASPTEKLHGIVEIFGKRWQP